MQHRRCLICYKKEDDDSERKFFIIQKFLSQEKTIYRLFKLQTSMSQAYQMPEADDLIINLKENLDILCGDLNLVLVNTSSDYTLIRRIRNFIEDNLLKINMIILL